MAKARICPDGTLRSMISHHQLLTPVCLVMEDELPPYGGKNESGCFTLANLWITMKKSEILARNHIILLLYFRNREKRYSLK